MLFLRDRYAHGFVREVIETMAATVMLITGLTLEALLATPDAEEGLKEFRRLIARNRRYWRLR